MKRVLFAAAIAFVAATSPTKATTAVDKQAWADCFQYQPAGEARTKCLESLALENEKERIQREAKIKEHDDEIARAYKTRVAEAQRHREVIAETFVLCIKNQIAVLRNSRDSADLVAIAALKNCDPQHEAFVENVFFLEHIPSNYINRTAADQDLLNNIIAMIVTDRAN
jgi:hypothetical protein